ncbi:LLM class flavin-dependent oxidoreductase [Bradyrhizobium erythrophlei]|uniref:Flavin-dependent oxidoreductase, luciferase family (Includes alkanesulfonate monooxygenase SsuD and methylene tetrahydromethanopterin reductase) n=1 Tax=Bradyrhizobium erythrophlei TaxID=1437360 RepID=A0A1H4XCY4_9BRAD|nr:LLM class flavin-dependent oxidoreductase [Bradyrhizobium erythrophlei]SED03435.1 Flavin-dependent oxidoreductase, luciferase family (includes alkanesulfonate monooxygenase SsuD and methylene tetrahydromethanopterin reductase) [Bradyrhizobium erythrophlei]
MRFIFFSEGETPPGHTHAHRYRELIDEVILAEKVGFDAFGCSEQHFAIGTASTSAPEVIYPYMMALTSRIQFIHLITPLPKKINHALRVAERLATEDILSNGRVGLAVGRGNTTLALRAFEVDPEETKAQQMEGIEVIRRALSNDIFSFVGEHYKIPPRSLTPKHVTLPYPPIMMATSSPQSITAAARMGIGAMMGGGYSGFASVQRSAELYDKELASAEHVYPVQAQKVAVISGGMHCADTNEEAERWAATLAHSVALSIDAYERLSKLSADYGSLGKIKNIDFKNKRYLFDESGSFIVGDVETCTRQVQRFVDMGIDALALRIDGMPHKELMKSIELFGKYVIPRFKNHRSVVRTSDAILADIRAARPAHYAEREAFENAKAAAGTVDGAVRHRAALA